MQKGAFASICDRRRRASPTDTRLFGREHHVADIAGFLADEYRSTSTLIVEGVPWSGRTALLGTAHRLAAEGGFMVVRADARFSERDRPRALLEQLLGVAPGDSARVRLEPQIPSAAIAEWIRELEARMASGPTAILVDDAHWADGESLDWLSGLAASTDDRRLRLVLVTRARRPGGRFGVLDQIRADRTTQLLRVGPLDKEAVSDLLESVLGEPCAGRAARSVHKATEGYPKLVMKFAGAMASGVEDVQAAVCDEVIRDLLSRLAKVEDASGSTLLALLQSVAILGEQATLATLRGMAGGPPADAEFALDVLLAKGLLAEDQSLRFVHQVVHEAVLREMGPSKRSALHSRAAKVLEDDGYSRSIIAGHLLHVETPGDPRVAEQLEQLGREALARDDTTLAGSLLTKALALAPLAAGPELLLDLARAYIQSDPHCACRHLRRSIELGADPSSVADLVLELLRASGEAYKADLLPRLGDLCLRLARTDPSKHTRLAIAMAELSDAPLERLEFRRIIAEAVALERLLRPQLRRVAGAYDVAYRFEADAKLTSSALAEQVLEVLDSNEISTESWLDVRGYGLAIRALALAGLPDDAENRWTAIRLSSRTPTTTRADLECLLTSGTISLAQGRLELARQHLSDALALGEHGATTAAARAGLVHALVDLGRIEEARDLTNRDNGDDRGIQLGRASHYELEALSRVLVIDGLYSEALSCLETAKANCEAAGIRSVPLTSWRFLMVEALLHVGDRSEATRLALEGLTVASSFGAPHLTAMALSVLAKALTGRERLDVLREAFDLARGTGADLIHARIAIQLGVALSGESGRRPDARSALRTGADLALRCGASPLVEYSVRWLRAAGGRPRRLGMDVPEVLTPTESRVAHLAANGCCNAEIANRLFINEKTVEGHLTRTYRKLGISTRNALPERLTSLSLSSA